MDFLINNIRDNNNLDSCLRSHNKLILCNYKSLILMTSDVDKGYLLFLGLHIANNKEKNLRFLIFR